MPKSFFWYTLMTTDMDAAKDFYADVVGWRPEAWGGSGTPPYTLKYAG